MVTNDGERYYLDYNGLQYYDGKMKNMVHTEDEKRVDKKDIITKEVIDHIIAGLL